MVCTKMRIEEVGKSGSNFSYTWSNSYEKGYKNRRFFSGVLRSGDGYVDGIRNHRVKRRVIVVDQLDGDGVGAGRGVRRDLDV